jgi:mannose-6-phosphate isomerase-like protein (cupin superfamily)
MHVHHRDDETFFILEGEFEFHVGNEVIRPKPGDFVFGPRDIPHTFTNLGATDARMLVTVSSAGLEEFFAESQRILEKDPANIEGVAAVGARYGLEFVAPE